MKQFPADDVLEKFKNDFVFNDGNIALIDNLALLDQKILVKVDFFAIMICEQGKCVIDYNDNNYTINKGDLMVCIPNMILENAMTSIDFKCKCYCISLDYAEHLFLTIGQNWDTKIMLENNPIVHLEDADIDMFNDYFYFLKKKLSKEPNHYSKAIIESCINILIYEMSALLEKYAPLSEVRYTSAESIFCRFINILNGESAKNRTVAYFAEMLYITPKYLSAVCKKMTNYTASDIIAQYTIKEVQYLLKSREKSIKEISAELNFPNISFFGKYVKKHLGVSPREYRRLNTKQ